MAETLDSADVPSPCTKVCKLDRTSGLCMGCLRTSAEVEAWRSLRPDQKRALLDRLKLRRLPSQPQQC